ncbi:hypothetical protein PhCBS80983_g04374 [Powellomyces hirtus]|uniref:PPPDE domain-containing protein n=1 Tax=Powellomyces hirtus TaxID=109895 RepID=A0A507DZQ4_9FUNG|nr:hypothetical protein PhCBS80983_g04374 [Powellomyces hirtus]
MSQMESSVQLYLYDLSQGMARMMSRQLTGRQIDGIWHTSVVVYGVEYFFGQGIMESRPGQTHHGVPLQVIPMGQTQIPRDMFLEYLEGMKEAWTADKYHLLDNNCNTFSNELCNFLVGKDIPAHITGLPAEFLNTPFGQSLRPMLENMFGPSQVARSAAAASAAATHTNPLSPALASLVGNVAAAAQSGPTSSTALQIANNLSQFNSIIASHRCVVVDFTAQTCPPCRVISPEFERLIGHFNAEYRQIGMGEAARSDTNKIVGVKVEVPSARDIAAQYQITATPTFVFFLDGKKTAQFSGANKQELKAQMELLLYTAFPPHPHAKIRTPTLDSMSSNPILYSRSTSLDAIFTKLQTFCTDAPKEMQAAIPALQSALKNKFENESTAELNITAESVKAVDWMLESLPMERVFPALDILRLMALDAGVRQKYLARKTGVTFMSLLAKYGCGDQEREQAVPKAVRVMVLRLACNLFTDAESMKYSLSLNRTTDVASRSTPHRTIITAVLIDSLLSPEAVVRKDAASLAFNIAVEEAKSRQTAAGVAAGVEDVGVHEEWIAEIVAAAGNALATEEDDEIVLRLLTALAHLLHYATDPILQLASAVGLADTIDATRESRETKLESNKKLKATPQSDSATPNQRLEESDIKMKESIIKLCKEVGSLMKVV